jgi:hypothetical protein
MASENDLDGVEAHELGERLEHLRARFDEFRGRL